MNNIYNGKIALKNFFLLPSESPGNLVFDYSIYCKNVSEANKNPPQLLRTTATGDESI